MDVKPTLSFVKIVNAFQFYLIDVLVLPMKPNMKNIVRKRGQSAMESLERGQRKCHKMKDQD